MKTLKSIFLFAIIIAMAGCKKGDNGMNGVNGANGLNGTPGQSGNPDQRIYSKWRLLNDPANIVSIYYITYGMQVTYFNINKDNTYNLLMQDTAFGYRNYSAYLSFITSTQISLSNNYYDYFYNYSFSGDTLFLTNPLTGTATLLKDTAAPVWNQWVTVVSTAADSVRQNAYITGDFGFDGQNLWTSHASNQNILYKINTVTHQIDSLALSFSATKKGTVEYGGGYLWVMDNGSFLKLHQVSLTGNDIGQSPVFRSEVGGIAWDGQRLWCMDSNDTLYQYTPGASSFDSKECVKGTYVYGLSGIAYANGYLYMTNENLIHKCSINPFKVIKTYSVQLKPAVSVIAGIAYDGSNFWIASSGDYTIYKVALN